MGRGGRGDLAHAQNRASDGVSRGGWESGRGGGRGGGAGSGELVEGTARRVVSAAKPKDGRSSNFATATYSWGIETRKGAPREKFTATVDDADMAKVRRRNLLFVWLA